jgi:hypothetical protein
LDEVLTLLTYAGQQLEMRMCPSGSSGDSGSNEDGSIVSGATSAMPSMASSGSMSSRGSVWSVESAEERERVLSAGLRFEPCERCAAHLVDVLYACTHGFRDGCRRVLDTGALPALMVLAGLTPGGSGGLRSAPCSPSSLSLTDSLSPSTLTSSLPPACEYCASSRPNVYTTFPQEHYAALWGKNAHGRPGCLDLLAEVARYDG